MTKAIANTFEAAAMRKLYISYFLLAGCIAFAVIYAFSLYNLVSNTVALKSLEKDRTEMERTIGSLDAEYLALTHDITPEIVASLGMKEAEASMFISRNASLGRVSVVPNGL